LQGLGVVNFLTKPYDIQKLLKTVHDAITGQSNGSPSPG
jgi:FixJ family two-component response regulator